MPDLSVQLSRSLARVHGIKAVQPQAQPGVLDVLIAPFWGPNNGRDAHGQYFTPETEFMHDVIPTPPVFFYHGAEMGEAPTPIGKSTDATATGSDAPVHGGALGPGDHALPQL
jgi:hypothetical protein